MSAIKTLYALGLSFFGYLALQIRLSTPALALLRKAVAWRPQDVDLRHYYGRICVDLSKLSEAEHVFRQLLALRSDWVDVRYALASVLQKQNRHEEAIEELEKVVSRETENPTVHYNLGISLAALKRWNKAMEAFVEANRLEPDAVDVSTHLGIAYAEARQSELATVWFEKAVRLEASAASYVNLGVNQHELGELEKAKSALQTALALDPESSEVRWRLAAVLLDENKREEALAVLESVTQSQPSALGEALRSHILLKLGRLHDARRAAASAVDKDPDRPEARASLGFVALIAKIAAAFANRPTLLPESLVFEETWETEDLIRDLAVVGDPPDEAFIAAHSYSVSAFTAEGFRHVLPEYLQER